MGLVELRSGDGYVLVGPPGLFPGSLRAHRRRYAAMQALFGSPRAVSRLRWEWANLGLGGEARVASDTELRAMFERALAQNRLVALHVPAGGFGELPVSLVAPVAAPKIGATPAVRPPVAAWSRGERIEEALRRSTAHVGAEFRQLIDQLLSAETVAVMVAFCIAIVLAQAGGVSAAALDAALLAIAYGCAGFAGIQALYELIAAAVTAAEARTDKDLDDAAKRFAYAFTKLGEAFIAWLLARLQGTRQGGPRQDKPAPRASVMPDEPPPASPPRPPKAIAKSPQQLLIDEALARAPPEFRAAYAQAEAAGWKLPNGDPWYPPYPGSLEKPFGTLLPKGTLMDRFGGEGGSFLSKAGESFASRALPQAPGGAPNLYTVAKSLLVEQGEVAPWFGQTGGGTQYRLIDPITGKSMSVSEAKTLGYLIDGALK